MFSREFVLLWKRSLMKNKAEFICSQIGGRQNIIETLLGQISVMSQLEVVNTVAANLISNLISLASVELIFNFHNTSIYYSPRSNGLFCTFERRSERVSIKWPVLPLRADRGDGNPLWSTWRDNLPNLVAASLSFCVFLFKKKIRTTFTAWNSFGIFHDQVELIPFKRTIAQMDRFQKPKIKKKPFKLSNIFKDFSCLPSHPGFHPILAHFPNRGSEGDVSYFTPNRGWHLRWGRDS